MMKRTRSGFAAVSLCLAGLIWPASGSTQPAPPVTGNAPAPHLEYAFEELVYLGKASAPGKTAYGGRNIIPITGGTFEGPGVKGTIVPGGWDWQLVRADGCIDVHADYMLKTDDGVIINVKNDGAICPPRAGEPPRPVRTSPRFEPPLGKYEWLGQSAFIGTLDIAKGPEGQPAVRIRFYRAR